MNPQHIPKPVDELEGSEAADADSVEDFIKQLEEKEKDLHITADLRIEIEDSDVDVAQSNISEISFEEPVRSPRSTNEPSTAQESERTFGLKTRVHELEQDIWKLEARVTELKAERNDIQEKSDRRLKDFESFKYRMDRERRGAFIEQLANLASQMLPVMDNIERAISSVPTQDGERDPSFEQFIDGVFLVNQQIKNVFANMGVEPIVTVGQPFDPNNHEAVATEEREDLPNNTIIDEMLRGYRIGNRVIRHSMVKVSTSPAGTEPRPEAEAGSDDAQMAEADRLLEEAFAGNDVESLEELFESHHKPVGDSPAQGPTPESEV
jgi:molecular chaperone GrpE